MSHTTKSRKPATTTTVSSNGSFSKIFNYGDTAVTFRTVDGLLMVNATQMAKPFKKRVSAWLRLPSTRAFILALIDMRSQNSVMRKSHNDKHTPLYIKELKTNGLLYGKTGGRGGGSTYLHEDIAIEFARWLSPSFAVWCNDRIKELFRQGVAQQHPQEQPQPQSPEMLSIDGVLQRLREATDLVTALKQERAERERLEAILANIKSQIDSVPSTAERLPILIPDLF